MVLYGLGLTLLCWGLSAVTVLTTRPTQTVNTPSLMISVSSDLSSNALSATLRLLVETNPV